MGRLRFPARTEFLCFLIVALGCESANRVQTQFRCPQQLSSNSAPKAMAYSGRRARSSGIVGRLRFPARTEFLCFLIVALGCESANRVQTQFRCHQQLSSNSAPKAMAYSGSRARSSGIVGRLRFPARTEFLCFRIVALGCESSFIRSEPIVPKLVNEVGSITCALLSVGRSTREFAWRPATRYLAEEYPCRSGGARPLERRCLFPAERKIRYRQWPVLPIRH